MRLINAIRFLLTFIFVAFASCIICLIYGTEKALIGLQNMGILLTNDKDERSGKK